MELGIFFYDEEHDAVSSLSKYHAEHCLPIEPLVDAHPNVIYFYAYLIPS